MKKLDLIPGSLIPLWQQDLLFIQDEACEAIEAVLKGLELGCENYLVCGCKITVNKTASTVSMTAGWCFFQGELLPVASLPETEFNGASPLVKLSKVMAYNPSGDRQVTLSTGIINRQVWQECYLMPSLATVNDTYILALSEGAWTLAERISGMTRASDTGMVEVGLSGSHTGSVSYRMIGGTVQLYGMVKSEKTGDPVNGQIAVGLPHPAVPVRLTISDGGYMILDTDGNLTVYNTTLTRVYLDNVVYLTSPTYNSDTGHHSNTGNQGGGSEA